MAGTKYRYTVIFEPAAEGGYLARVPALNGLVIDAPTLEEARREVREAIAGYIEALQDVGDEIPVEQPDAFAEVVDVAIAR